jgi:alkylation response protein AidB-like acyl-CoA dehydrogenase
MMSFDLTEEQFAWSDAEKKQQRDVSGISCFIVERAFKGFSSGTLKQKWGILAGNTGYFNMDDSDSQISRLLWMRSGWLKNIGQRNTRETSLAKWFSTVASEKAAGNAVQVHGANGYSDEYPVGRYYRNCKGAV